jgi:WD40 repeat protein
VGGDTGNVSLWDVADGAQVRATNVGTAPVFAVKFAPDGKTLAVSDGKTGIRILAIPDLSQKAELRSQDGVILALAFSSDGRRLASSIATSAGGSVDLWSMSDRSSRCLLEVSGRALSDVTFSGTDLLAAQVRNESTYIWRDGIDQKPVTVKVAGDRRFRATCLVFCPDGSRLAVVGTRDLRMMDVRTEKWEVLNVFEPQKDDGIFTRQDEIKDIAFSSDGKHLAMAVAHSTQSLPRPYFSGSVHVWTVEPLRRLRAVSVPQFPVTAVEFVRDGRTVVSATVKGRIDFWSVESPP